MEIVITVGVCICSISSLLVVVLQIIDMMEDRR